MAPKGRQMDLSPIEQHVLAYYLVNGAQDFAMVGRFFPYGELTLVLQDKMNVAIRKFGTKATMAAPAAARAFLDDVIAREGFSTVKNKFGGAMHQFQPDTYPKVLKDLQDALGRYQDAAAGRQLFAQHAAEDASAWFGAGWLAAREETLAHDCQDACRRAARREKPFWK